MILRFGHKVPVPVWAELCPAQPQLVVTFLCLKASLIILDLIFYTPKSSIKSTTFNPLILWISTYIQIYWWFYFPYCSGCLFESNISQKCCSFNFEFKLFTCLGSWITATKLTNICVKFSPEIFENQSWWKTLPLSMLLDSCYCAQRWMYQLELTFKHVDPLNGN